MQTWSKNLNIRTRTSKLLDIHAGGRSSGSQTGPRGSSDTKNTSNKKETENQGFSKTRNVCPRGHAQQNEMTQPTGREKTLANHASDTALISRTHFWKTPTIQNQNQNKQPNLNWAKILRRHLSEGDTQAANKQRDAQGHQASSGSSNQSHSDGTSDLPALTAVSYGGETNTQQKSRVCSAPESLVFPDPQTGVPAGESVPRPWADKPVRRRRERETSGTPCAVGGTISQRCLCCGKHTAAQPGRSAPGPASQEHDPGTGAGRGPPTFAAAESRPKGANQPGVDGRRTHQQRRHIRTLGCGSALKRHNATHRRRRKEAHSQ